MTTVASRKQLTAESSLSPVEAKISDSPLTANRENGAIDGVGLFGKQSHALAELSCERAEQSPDRMRKPHNAQGPLIRRGETRLVEKIARVGDDIVTHPATNTTLFESVEERSMNKTVEQIAASASDSQKTRTLKRLLELEPETADLPVETEAEPAADPAAEVKTALEKAAVAVIKKLLSGELDEATAFEEIKRILGMQDEAGSGEQAISPAEPTVESVEIKQLRAEIKARALLEEANVKATTERVEAVASLGTETKRKALIESFAKRGDGLMPSSSAPLFESYGEGETTCQSVDDFKALLDG